MRLQDTHHRGCGGTPIAAVSGARVRRAAPGHDGSLQLRREIRTTSN